jgi:hypothetical protein
MVFAAEPPEERICLKAAVSALIVNDCFYITKLS